MDQKEYRKMGMMMIAWELEGQVCSIERKKPCFCNFVF